MSNGNDVTSGDGGAKLSATICSARELAEKIADEIFHDGGVGKEAQRLILSHEDPTKGYMGGGSGWGKKPITDRIEEIIRQNVES